MKKRILALLLAAVMLMAAVPAVSAADAPSYAVSGSLSMEKLSKREIVTLLAGKKTVEPDGFYARQPDLTAPYQDAGEISSLYRQAALERLNVVRRIAGLPEVTVDAEFSRLAQAATYADALFGKMTHTPGQAPGLDDALYSSGCEGASSSNIAWSSGRRMNLVSSVDLWMDDTDTSNIERLGHRRWVLNPTMSATGFGHCSCDSGTYTAMYSFDRSGAAPTYDYISWPASGFFPTGEAFFNSDTAWSVTLNPDEYQTPSLSSVTVTLVRESDNRTWTFSGAGYAPSSLDDYFNVETSWCGVPNCIIFRPGNVEAYRGGYTVEIAGLKTSGGADTTLDYRVEFFDPADLSFSDVPAGEWYAEAVDYAVDNGLMKGTGNRQFSPNGIITRAEVLTILARLEGADVEGSNPWYDKTMDWAHTTGVSDSDQPLEEISRAELATLLYRCANSPSVTDGYLDPWPDASDVPGDAAPGLAWCVEHGIIQGSDTGMLLPLGTANRAQVATMMQRYCTVLHI